MLKTPADVTDANVDEINKLSSSQPASTGNAVLTYNEIKQDFGYDGDDTRVCSPNGKSLTDVLGGIRNTTLCFEMKFSGLMISFGFRGFDATVDVSPLQIETPRPCYIAPGVTNGSKEMIPWLTQHEACYTNSLTKWNAVAFHFYGAPGSNGPNLDSIWSAYFGMRGVINDLYDYAVKHNRELWMTEFGLDFGPGNPQPSFIQNLQFMCLALCGIAYDRNISYFAGTYKPKVAKYAWYAACKI